MLLLVAGHVVDYLVEVVHGVTCRIKMWIIGLVNRALYILMEERVPGDRFVYLTDNREDSRVVRIDDNK